MHVAEWMEQIDRDYLQTYVKQGGAAVKFIVGDRQLRSDARASLTARAEQSGYLVLHADAAQQRFHMPQDIFFALAAQVNWRLTARRFLVRLAAREGFHTDGVDAAAADVLQAIADHNDVQKEYVATNLNPHLHRQVFSDVNMAKDFRIAMSHLCQFERGTEQPYPEQTYPGQAIVDWLTGANTRLGNVKPFSIYNPINRSTARHLLRSACYWFHRAGYAGTVLVLDNAQVTERKRAGDGSRYYTRPMTMDHYEILREFIDGSEHLAATLIVTCTAAAFLDQEADRQSRGVGIYPALLYRIIDDVHDKRMENPAAALCRLAG